LANDRTVSSIPAVAIQILAIRRVRAYTPLDCRAMLRQALVGALLAAAVAGPAQAAVEPYGTNDAGGPRGQ
jgi:hypothetical protein